MRVIVGVLNSSININPAFSSEGICFFIKMDHNEKKKQTMRGKHNAFEVILCLVCMQNVIV